MPDGRFLSRAIATNGQLARCSAAADFLFGRMIPWADREGRLPGSPGDLRFMCVPRRTDLFPDDEAVARALAELEREKLVVRYTAPTGLPVLWLPTFPRHQRGLRKSREAPSKYPPPPPELYERFRVPEDDHPLPAVGSAVGGAVPAPDPALVVTPPPPPPPAEKAAEKATGKETWLTPYLNEWREGYGVDAVNPKLFAKYLAPVREALGEEEAQKRWGRYIATTELQYASPKSFAERHPAWSDAPPVKGNGGGNGSAGAPRARTGARLE